MALKIFRVLFGTDERIIICIIYYVKHNINDSDKQIMHCTKEIYN